MRHGDGAASGRRCLFGAGLPLVTELAIKTLCINPLAIGKDVYAHPSAPIGGENGNVTILAFLDDAPFDHRLHRIERCLPAKSGSVAGDDLDDVSPIRLAQDACIRRWWRVTAARERQEDEK